MTTLSVPTFKIVWPVGKKHHTYEFDKYVNVTIKNEPDSKDYWKVVKHLPGMPQGYVKDIYTIGKTHIPIEIIRFYDTRQNPKLLKGFFISVVK